MPILGIRHGVCSFGQLAQRAPSSTISFLTTSSSAPISALKMSVRCFCIKLVKTLPPPIPLTCAMLSCLSSSSLHAPNKSVARARCRATQSIGQNPSFHTFHYAP